MQQLDSYVAEAQARQRRRMATGAVAAVMLAAAGLSVLMVYDGAQPTPAERMTRQADALATDAGAQPVPVLR